VLDLVAQGRTTKEMSHALGITERGVAAQISRLLSKFDVSNRASLVAALLSELTVEEEPPRPLRSWTDLSAVVAILGTDLSALHAAAFYVALTLGRNHLIAFMSESAERTMGISVATAFGTPLRDRLEMPVAPQWALTLGESFRTGAAAFVEDLPLSWRRDDGTADSGLFTCIAQPLRGVDGLVHGTLFVCTTRPRGAITAPER
jgi:hypothetical protein